MKILDSGTFRECTLEDPFYKFIKQLEERSNVIQSDLVECE